AGCGCIKIRPARPMPYGSGVPRSRTTPLAGGSASSPRKDGRVGRPKISVDAAPSASKTLEMLQSAHVRLKASVEVVVGMVETHGRAEAEALLRGLEVIPRKWLEYSDQILEEIDLNAFIARRSQIALVDELAYTN